MRENTMIDKERDKQQIQQAKDQYRSLVRSDAVDAEEKWSQIRERIERFRQDAANTLKQESQGVVAHDRRAKLAAFACEYAIVYYESLKCDAMEGIEEEQKIDRKIGDLARYLTGIKSVPRAAPQLNAKEKTVRDYWTLIALRHYETMAGPLKVYTERIRRLMKERQETNVLLPFLFTARKVISDQRFSLRNKTLALDYVLRELALDGIHSDFVYIALETTQAAVNCGPLQLSRAAQTQVFKRWNEPLEKNTLVDDTVSVIVALVLIAFCTRKLVPNVGLFYQQLFKSARLHGALLDVFVDGHTSTLSPVLKHFVEVTTLEGGPLSEKVRTLASYPARF